MLWCQKAVSSHSGSCDDLNILKVLQLSCEFPVAGGSVVLSLPHNTLTSGRTQLQLLKSDGEASPLQFLPLPFPWDSEWGHFQFASVSRWSVSSIKVESASVLTAATLPVIMPFVVGPCPRPGEYSSGFQKAHNLF